MILGRAHTHIQAVLDCDWNSSVAGDGRFDLVADSVTPFIDAEGGDVISEELADGGAADVYDAS